MNQFESEVFMMKKALTIVLTVAMLLGVCIVSASAVTYGDANSDGEVSVKDLVILSQYIAGFPVTVDTLVSDVNSDGEITMKDAVRIAQHLAWGVELGGGAVTPPDDGDDNSGGGSSGSSGNSGSSKGDMEVNADDIF